MRQAEGFVVKIHLGNDAMRTKDDIAGALRKLAKKVAEGYTEGKLLDENGNTVGCFHFTAGAP